ncbi:holo-ACP synthase [Paenibacillus albus]|uniref:Holo-[acyl-carrier-protein] synthase n=1 Tax=Paenibacillus albus TaxID=2495582 RepID=A0A3Q8X3X3_9BACL|nr:holo-ACP synthase [Paenibacillus albus]AZN39902.1 holo-[acyl-carrier-protein] synthase [Paenibacillus albus]
MIIGIGHDISSIDRMEKLLQGEIGKKFISRILTGREQELAAQTSGSRRVEFVSGRFAAKEAVSKAFGCGIGSTLGFQDIEIDRHSSGRPICRMSEGAWARLGLGSAQTRIHVSISHDHSLASAYVIAEQVQAAEE